MKLIMSKMLIYKRTFTKKGLKIKVIKLKLRPYRNKKKIIEYIANKNKSSERKVLIKI